MSNYYKKQQKKVKKKPRSGGSRVRPSGDGKSSSSKSSTKSRNSQHSKASTRSGNALSLDSFTQVQALAIGAFGTVSVVRHEQTAKLYALKSIDKAEAIRLEELESIEAERSILNSIDKPYIVKLYKSFKDERNVHMLLEFVGGGSLHHHLAQKGSFEESIVVFYTIELVAALETLHSSSVAHGTLCAEHVLLDDAGHVTLNSLSGAQLTSKSARSQTRLVPLYAAPERFRAAPASPEADWWALGCLIYEMFTGSPPFVGDSPLAVAEAISAGDNRLPIGSKLVPTAAKDVVRRLLTHDPSKREKGAQLRTSKWLKGADWKSIESRKGSAPLAKEAAEHAEGVTTTTPDASNALLRAAPPIGPPIDVSNKLFVGF